MLGGVLEVGCSLASRSFTPRTEIPTIAATRATPSIKIMIVLVEELFGASPINGSRSMAKRRSEPRPDANRTGVAVLQVQSLVDVLCFKKPSQAWFLLNSALDRLLGRQRLQEIQNRLRFLWEWASGFAVSSALSYYKEHRSLEILLHVASSTICYGLHSW